MSIMIENILLSCRARIPWVTMRNILHAKNLPVGQGWEASIQKLISYQQEGEEQARHINSLEDSYFEHLLTGERSLRLYKLNDEHLDSLERALKKIDIKGSIYHESYPYPLTESRLRDADSSTHLIQILDLDECSVFVFCTKRFITERQELSLDSFRQETKDDLKAYDEIIAVKHKMRQLFDVVVLRKNDGIAEVRIDLNGGCSADDQDIAFNGIVKTFNKMVHELTDADSFLHGRTNLFPLVNKLYESDEGRVCELGFTTDEASIKHEKMRRREFDLREETYHRAGKDAVRNITPYRLGICWTVPITETIESKPELLLPGSFRTLNMMPQFLGEAMIEKCCGFDDYNFVVNKMIEYLSIANNEIIDAEITSKTLAKYNTN